MTGVSDVCSSDLVLVCVCVCVCGCMYLEHLLDFLPWQIYIEFVQELKDLADAQGAISVLIRLRKRLL